MTEDQRQQWKRALAGKAAQQRRQHGPQARGIRIRNGHSYGGAGMIRLPPPDRAATVARIVRAALGSCPSIAAARRAIEDWAGHPSDPAMKDDALAMLDRIEQEARQ